MLEKVTVSSQVPPEWKAKIERLAADRKKTPNEIIYEAIAQYLGEDVKTNDSRLNILETDVSMLQRQVGELNLTIKSLRQRLLVSATSTISIVETTSNEDEDFIEDEPDEILYSFLPPEERP